MKYAMAVVDYTGELQSDDLSMLIDAGVFFWDTGLDVTIIENAIDKIVWLNGEYV